MPGKMVFLLEEPSMKVFLDSLLLRLFPMWREGVDFLCVKHEGKSDLDKSIPIKLRAWKEPNICFVIVRDNDSADCIATKAKLHTMCKAAGRPDTLIRLVCQELESWYLGDLEALDKAFGTSLNTPQNRKRFAHPDERQKPSGDLKRLIPHFQKVGGAHAVSRHVSLESSSNRSHSFQVFVEGIRMLQSKHPQ
jgi:hypothetical protein